MLQNYLLIASRNILRNKLTSLINVAGLAMALASVVLIYLFIVDEVSYDKYHSKSDRIYRVTRNFLSQDGTPNLHLATVAPPFGPLIKNDFGEVEQMARTLQYTLVMAIEENGERKKMATEENVFMAEPELFNIFDIQVVSGNPSDAITRPLTVMLSEKTAQKYFESTDVIGKHLKAGRQLDLEVTGVYKDFPAQSHWHPDFLVAFSTLNDSTIYGRKRLETNYGNNAFSTYLLLDEGVTPDKISARFPEFLDKHYGNFIKSNFNVPPTFVASKTTTLFLQKVTDIHLRSHLDDEIELSGSINNVYMMGVIAAFLLLIACFNFVNLSTARATKRAKEVGLRKAAGAFRNQLITQFLGESILVTTISLVLAIGLAFLALDWLNRFTGKSMDLNLLQHPVLAIGLLLFAVVVGALSGIYPAFVISSFRPAVVLKGLSGSNRGNTGIRKVLVVSQFAISIVLLIATAITVQQLGFLNSASLGFDKEKLIVLPYYGELNDIYDAFYNEITKSSAIASVGRSSRIPTGRLLDSQGTPLIMKGDSLVNSGIELKYVCVDYDFFNSYHIRVVAGRNFSRDIPTDDSLAFIVNEAAVRKFGWKTPEEGINQDFSYGNTKGKLIGVVSDFHFESLHQEIKPMVFFVNYFNRLSIRIAGNNLQEGIEHVGKVWKSFLPNRPFDYSFLSDRYTQLYESEQKQGQLFTVFAGMAIFIACLGLFGLATFNTLQRIKEIGIRKVLGATVPDILTLLSREIVILILVANVIAWPVAWYFMDKWLGSFAYHISMNLLVYVAAALVAILVAVLTVSTQSFRAARTNPAKTLRYE